MTWWLAIQQTIAADQDHFLKEQKKILPFNSDIKNFLLKTNGGRDRRPNFVIFLVWSGY